MTRMHQWHIEYIRAIYSPIEIKSNMFEWNSSWTTILCTISFRCLTYTWDVPRNRYNHTDWMWKVQKATSVNALYEYIKNKCPASDLMQNWKWDWCAWQLFSNYDHHFEDVQSCAFRRELKCDRQSKFKWKRNLFGPAKCCIQIVRKMSSHIWMCWFALGGSSILNFHENLSDPYQNDAK